VSTLILQAQYFRYKLGWSQGPVTALQKFLADLVILAIHTAQIASAEKNGPGTFGPGNRGLFTKMQTCMGNPDPRSDPAKTGFPFPSVHPAFSGAAFTFRQLISE